MTTNTRSWLPSYSGSRITRRKFLAGAGAGLGAAALIACGGGSGSGGLKFDDAATARQPGTVWNAGNDWKLADETKEAVKGGIYPTSMSADQAGSYDALLPAPSQVPFSRHVHEFLMARTRGPGIDPKSAEAAVPTPILAQDMQIASDGLTVTFTMRPNVKWHPVAPVNGRVMDMDDWKTTLERFLALSAQREVILDILNKAEYPDANHMVWKLNYPYSPMIDRIWSERFAFQIVPKELNLNQQLAESTSIGTGYKILDKHQPSVTMEYRAHKDYWGGAPFIDRWHFPIIPEYANRYAQFVAQNTVDFTPSTRDVLGLAKDTPQAVIVAADIPDDHVSWMSFGRDNMDKSPWKDPRVRVAIRQSLNLKGMGEFLANKQQFEASGIPVSVVTRSLLPHNPGWHLDSEKGELGKLSENYTFNLTSARQLISAAGATAPIDINFYTLPAGGGAIPEQDQLFMDGLNQSGLFKVNTIRSLNTVEHRLCRSLRQCSGFAQTAINEDVDYWLAEYSTAGSRPGGEPAITDPRLDQIKAAYRREFDPEKRIALMKDEQMVLAEFMPAIPFIDLYTSFSFRWPWLHNINHGDGSGVTGRPVWGGHLQWLDAEMPKRNG